MILIEDIMRRLGKNFYIVAMMALLFCAGYVYAQAKRVYSYESVSQVGGTALALSSTKYANGHGAFSPDTEEAFMTLETGAIRWRADNVAPTLSEGHVLSAGESITLIGYTNMSNFKSIATVTPTGVLKVTYFRE